jgi:alpha-ribazole phosphatase
MKRLVLLRHGEIEGYHNTYIGSTDAHLSASGREQAIEAAAQLSLKSFDSIYCSPLHRCRETLEILERPEHIIFDERLKEINFGRWEAKTFEDIQAEYPALVNEWSAGIPEFRFPDGDKIHDFRYRVSNFAQQLYHNEDSDILIVSHGGVIRHLICAFLNIPFENYLYFKIDYGKFVLLDVHSHGGVLTGLNRRSING